MATRALHFVYKIANRKKTIDFYRNVLHMKCLRHEEFEEGCKASCNGPYDGKWSKSMFGYGDEDNNFVVELTYNYGVKEYKHGNDYNYLEINSLGLFNTIIKSCSHSYELSEDGGSIDLNDPNGYRFKVSNTNTDTLPKVTTLALTSSNLLETEFYWNQVLSMKVLEVKAGNFLRVAFDEQQTELKFTLVDQVNHETAFGRVAFACPTSQLESIQAKIDSFGEKYKVLTRLVSLDTPGKATVSVVILADPNGHEICFVGDEGFKCLSQIDPNAEKLLDDAIANDKSDEWFEKKIKKSQK